MTLKLITILLLLFITGQVSAQEQQVLKTQKEKLSYGMGVEMGRNFKQNVIEVDVDLLLKGIKDALSGAALLISEDELQATITGFRQELIRKRARDKKLAAMDNKEEGDAFLAENMKKEGVVALPSGLQYKILKEGNGRKPIETDMVEVNYRGTLINGTEFDNTYRTGKPATFELKTAIPGLREALKLMPAGSKWQIIIPPELAYFTHGAGRYIGPNDTLIFELELTSIQAGKEMTGQ